VITVPAYFTTRSARPPRTRPPSAGLDVKRIIKEPTAARSAFGLEQGRQEGHESAVYDLGGGTFDISIIEIADVEARCSSRCSPPTATPSAAAEDFDSA